MLKTERDFNELLHEFLLFYKDKSISVATILTCVLQYPEYLKLCKMNENPLSSLKLHSIDLTILYFAIFVVCHLIH